MSFSVVTNRASLNANAQLTKTNFGLQQTLGRLSSGLRINSAADDAAVHAIANRDRMDVAGLQVGMCNSNDAVSRLQIEDGALYIISLITTYNELRQFASLQNNVNTSTGVRGPLANDSVLRQTPGDPREVLLTTNSNGSKYKYLSDIGISVDQTGNLQFDEKAYTGAITENPADVRLLLQGSGSVKGVFGTMKDKLQNLDGTAGLIKSSRDSITTTLTGVASQIAAAQARLDLRRKQLQQQFAAADEAISKLNAMTGQLSQLGSSKLS